MTTINNNNYELWLLRYAEGELTATERKAVDVWLAEHPEANEELVSYTEAPLLEADESVHYVGAVPGVPRPLSPVLLRWSAAAAVIVVVVLPLALHRNDAALPTEEVAMVNVEQRTETTELCSEKEEPISESPKRINKPFFHKIVDQPTAHPSLEQKADTAPALLLPQPSVIYVSDLIAYEEEEPAVDDVEQAALAMANEETVNNGISMPRLIGSILKSNIKIQ